MQLLYFRIDATAVVAVAVIVVSGRKINLDDGDVFVELCNICHH